jgi:hypothetical protein
LVWSDIRIKRNDMISIAQNLVDIGQANATTGNIALRTQRAGTQST